MKNNDLGYIDAADKSENFMIIDFLHRKVLDYGKNIFGFCFLCIVILSTIEVESDHTISSFDGDNSSFLTVLDDDSFDISANESVFISLNKNTKRINSRGNVRQGSKSAFIWFDVLFLFIFVLIGFLLTFYRTVYSKRQMLISYIHNQDGMKL